MDDALLVAIATRMDADPTIDDDVGLLVLAAMESESALDEAVAGEWPDRPTAADLSAPPEPKGAYLKSLTVEGFRGVGAKCVLELAPGPGLTLVVGRNGSGKSSFVEALEVLLTGDSRRWSARKEKAWREGWRNLHHADPTSVDYTEYTACVDFSAVNGGPLVAYQWRGETTIEPAHYVRFPATLHGDAEAPAA